MVDHETGRDGYDHHLDNGHKHADHIHIHLGARVHVGQKGGEEGRQHGGHRGHAHGQGNIALGEVGHNVGGGAAGAGSHQDDADCQLRRQPEEFSQQKCQQGHQGELCDGADDHVLGTGKYHLEVAGF